MATEVQTPSPVVPQDAPEADRAVRPGGLTPVQVMTYRWPDLKPERLVHYSKRLLQMPIRHDILHRAVVYEGDATRQGTASTKWRDDVHGSHRKLYAQKGSGRARAGDKQSPVRRGGGVAHGPHPRDFSTDLPRKIYDQAWRIALSHRLSRGELIVIDNVIDLAPDATPFFVKNLLQAHQWFLKGRSTFITLEPNESFSSAVEKHPRKARHLSTEDLDVKDLLETSRLIIERNALHKILLAHRTDLPKSDTLFSPSIDGKKVLTLEASQLVSTWEA
jgi:large subunit ribosomal protein L4